MIRNRHKARRARGDKSKWCGPCDGALVRDGGKCPACGKRDPHVRDKRPASDGNVDGETWAEVRAEADEVYRHRPDQYRSHNHPTEVALRVARAVQIRAEMRKRLTPPKRVPLTVEFLRDIGIERQESALDVFEATRGWRARANAAVLGDDNEAL